MLPKFSLLGLFIFLTGSCACCIAVAVSPCGTWIRPELVLLGAFATAFSAFFQKERARWLSYAVFGLGGALIMAIGMNLNYFIEGSMLIRQGVRVNEHGSRLFTEGFEAELIMLPIVSLFYFVPLGLVAGTLAFGVTVLVRLASSKASCEDLGK